MYNLSATEDLTFCARAVLIQVCLGENEVILNFDSDVRITILADFCVKPADGRAIRYDSARKGAAALLRLLNDSIASAMATPNGDLRILFVSGAELLAIDCSSAYESFWIEGPGHEIIV